MRKRNNTTLTDIQRELAAEHICIAKWISWQPYVPNYLRGECLSIARLSVCAAVQTFDPKKSDKIQSWIRYRAIFDVLNFIAKERKFGLTYMPMTMKKVDLDRPQIFVAQGFGIEFRSINRETLATFFSLLNDEEIYAVQMLLAGYRLTQAADCVMMNQRTVRRRLLSAHQKYTQLTSAEKDTA